MVLRPFETAPSSSNINTLHRRLTLRLSVFTMKLREEAAISSLVAEHNNRHERWMLSPVESNCFRNAPHNAMRTSQLPCPNNIQYKPGCSCLFQRFDWSKLNSLLVKASRKVRRGRNQHFAKWYHELPATHILSPTLVVGTSTPSVHSFHHSFLSDHFNSTFLPSAASRRLKNMATVLDGGVQVRYHPSFGIRCLVAFEIL